MTRLVSNGRVQAICGGAHELRYDVILVKDGHSTFNENPKATVDHYNEQLSSEGVVRLQATAEVKFEPVGTKYPQSI